MGRIFDLDSPVMRWLCKMADLMILNLVMLVMCVPIVTIGASITAMHYVLLKMVRDEDSYIVRSFFHSFKQNFKQATLIWLMMLGVIVLFVCDFVIMKQSPSSFPQVVVMILGAVAILLLCVFMYIFPVLARFDNTIRSTIKNAFFIMALNLPKTILMGLMYLFPIVLYMVLPASLPLILLFGVSVPAYVAAMLYNKIFRRFEPEPEKITSDEEFTVVMESEGDEPDENKEVE